MSPYTSVDYVTARCHTMTNDELRDIALERIGVWRETALLELSKREIENAGEPYYLPASRLGWWLIALLLAAALLRG